MKSHKYLLSMRFVLAFEEKKEGRKRKTNTTKSSVKITKRMKPYNRYFKCKNK